jgi:hypothetical protein
MYKGRVTETRTSEIPISTGVSNKGARIKKSPCCRGRGSSGFEDPPRRRSELSRPGSGAIESDHDADIQSLCCDLGGCTQALGVIGRGCRKQKHMIGLSPSLSHR